jgi:hypothetical protein
MDGWMDGWMDEWTDGWMDGGRTIEYSIYRIYIDSGYGSVEGSCEHGNEPSGSIKCWEILE